MGEAKFTPEMGVGGNHTPINFLIQAVQTARVVVPPWSKDTGHPDSRLFPVICASEELIEERVMKNDLIVEEVREIREAYTAATLEYSPRI
jgi:hypothetical protein